ncbi:MAG TPA: hypothetical protein VNE86_04925 [Nitrososphaerales archaeon]|nr:hypothetical protein [Nitrososphaerales archaeon]
MAEQIKHGIEMVKEARISKKRAGYIAVDDFKNSDLKHGYYCYNCVYYMNALGGKCLIVHSKGKDCFGKNSDVIAAYGYCPLWAANHAIVKKK